MSALLEQIKSDALAARKARESDKGVFLTTLAADVAISAKNDGNRAAEDKDVLRAIKRFENGLNEMLAARPGDAKTLAELAWLMVYKPVQPDMLGEAELDKLIGEIAAELGLAAVGPKDIGKVMGGLKKRAPGQFEGDMASRLIKARSQA